MTFYLLEWEYETAHKSKIFISVLQDEGKRIFEFRAV